MDLSNCTDKTCEKVEGMEECYHLLGTPYHFRIYNSITEFEDVWKSYEQNFSIFVSIDYFHAIEKCPPQDMLQRYVLLFEKDEIAALFPMQLKLFEAKESILDIEKNSSKLRKSLARRVKFNTLICGNISISGELMHCFVKGGLSPKNQYVLTEKIANAYRDVLALNGHKVNMIFMKDIPETRNQLALGISDSHFKSFNVEPLMVLYLSKEWSTFEDYLAEMSSKYRVRARRSFKKSSELSFRECNLEEIIQHEDVIQELYKTVLDNVNFSLFILPKNYFSVMKEKLGNKFKFYFVEDNQGKICAFYSMIDNQPELHAHYLGYDSAANKQHHIYLNLLYRMVDMGIKGAYEHIDFGRTALEIKSSVGAVPYDYSLYLMHRNPLANFFVPSIVNILNKKTQWVPRSPFKNSND